MEERRLNRGGIFFPLLLVGIGIMVLLSNLGYLTWDVWATLVRIWPILLIALGLDLLIGRRTALGSFLVFLLIAAVLGAGVWVALRPLSGQAVTSENISQPLSGATQADVEIGRSAGIITVGSMSGTQDLLQGTLANRKGESAVQDFHVTGNTAHYTLNNKGNVAGTQAGANQLTWAVDLNKRIPTALQVNCAAGQANLDLTDLNLTDLQVSLAVGQGTVTLPSAGTFSGKISGALGQLNVIVPRGQDLRATFSTALVSRSLPSDFVQSNDVYSTPGYANAESRIDLEIGLVMGSVNISYGP